ncbi:LysE family translocator [Pseudomonas oligotrophica]|uniref:LysE family translocator n=1 Tax=Pseudomonas oligotrophica TaxID=2912055 RepID=UPI001F35CD2C|nr:LysE family translocator [Pseudomonas oligotrophica]MCF7201031.1 LysE family translocator [Pseudomonas oligotrophica]
MNATYLTFAAAVALLIASPGPVVALVVADARRVWPLWTILGGVLSAQLLIICALLLIYLALDISPLLIQWGQVIGGLYLIWLGSDGLCGGTAEGVTTRRSEAHYFWRALAVGLSNPKDILFFLAFLPGFIIPGEPFAPQAAVLVLIWAAIDVSILLTYGLLSHRISGNRRIEQLLDVLPNYFLLGLGLVSCSLGISRLLQ